MSDAAARRLAQLEFAQPLLLEAGAGTGKTAVLVARIVAWCLGEGWRRAATQRDTDDAIAREVSSRVVAITFTEAAAAEMASRIASALAELVAGELPVGVCAEALPASLAERSSRARALRGALDHLTVRTIHAFCRRLLASHPLEAGLHPQLVVDADQQLAALAAREVLEERLLAAFSEGGDARGYAELAEARIGPADLETALIALLGEGARAADLGEAALADPAYAAFGASLQAALAALIAADGGRLAKGKRVDKAQEVIEVSRGLSEWLGESGPLSQRKLEHADVEALFAESLCARVAKWVTTAPKAFSDSERKALGNDIDGVRKAAAALHPLVSHLAKLKPAPLAAARDVLAELLRDARERLRARGVATYGSLLRDARELLENAEVARAVRGGIDQLLVDEFQDTDATQCALLASLAFGSGDRPTLFVVGDPKQSIYGWRNADLAAYDEFKARLIAEGGSAQVLRVSHRSVQPILDEVERLVAPVMHARHGLQPKFEPLEVSERRRGECGFIAGGRAAVEHWIGFDVDAHGVASPPDARTQSAREARAVADDLVRLRRDHGAAFGEIAILLRATTELPVVLGALREAGVPFVVERETAFYQRREVVDALALVRCVLDPHDQIALLTTLRSPNVGVPDAALIPLLEHCSPALIAKLGEDPHALAAAREKLGAAARATPSDVPGLAALAGWPDAALRFFEDLGALRQAFATLPADRFVELLRTRTGIEATEAGRRLGAHRVASLDRIFRDLVEWADALHGSPSQLLAALRRSGGLAREHQEGRPTSLAEDAVHVLTVHRAKGLDFKHVYLLQLHRDEGGRAQSKPTQVWRGARASEYQLLGLATPGAWAPMARSREREGLERIRLLYVAATRAKDRLVLSSSADRPAEPPPPESVKKLGHLLLHRVGGLALPGADSAQAALGVSGVLFRHLADSGDSEPEQLSARGPENEISIERVERDAAQLALAQAEAERREARPVQRVASELTHDDEAGAQRSLSDDAEPPVHAERPDRDRRIAMAAGTAVHAALEHVDFASDASALTEHGAREIARALAVLEPADERAAAESRARAIWQRACSGPLLARLRSLAPRILARELPVLLDPRELPPSDDAPVGFISGAIDLLYEDERGDIVVADYKTDDVTDDADLDKKKRQYKEQGGAYVNAVQLALGLAAPPRFELWFLDAGVVESA